MYNNTAILLIKNDTNTPSNDIIIVKTIAVPEDINPDGKGRFGALTLSTSISK